MRRTVLIAFGVVVLLAVGASSASAEPPEFGRCVRVAAGTGVYATAKCTEAGGEHKYEWLPGPGPKPGFHQVISGTEPLKIKLATNEGIECTGETATGEYTGPKTVGNVQIVLSGCGNENACGTIHLSAFHGELGVYALGETALKNKLGLKFAPDDGGQFAEFVCTGVGFAEQAQPIQWRGGSIIAPMPSNAMLLKAHLPFKWRYSLKNKVEQIPGRFVGEAPNLPESSAFSSWRVVEGQIEKSFWNMGWKMGTEVTNEERIEASSVR